MPETMSGSCKCDRVKFQVAGPISMAVNCHCNGCKKLSGSAFSTLVMVDRSDFKLAGGDGEVTRYQVSDRATKYFCRICGTPVYNEHVDLPGKLILPVGALDNPAIVTPTLNAHCENMLSWVPKIMQMKNFEQSPGG